MKEIFKHFAIMSVSKGSDIDQSEDSSGKLLCLAQEGYFASTAFIEGDERYAEVSGRSFGIITGDDGFEYKEDRSRFRRPKNMEEVEQLLERCSESFKHSVQLRLNQVRAEQ